MAWLQAGETWINMDQTLHITQEGDDAVVTFAVGLSTGTFPYVQRYGGEAASAIFAWLGAEAMVEAAENALTLATMEDEIEDEFSDTVNDAMETDTILIVEGDDDDDEYDDDDDADDEELLQTPPASGHGVGTAADED